MDHNWARKSKPKLYYGQTDSPWLYYAHLIPAEPSELLLSPSIAINLERGTKNHFLIVNLGSWEFGPIAMLWHAQWSSKQQHVDSLMKSWGSAQKNGSDDAKIAPITCSKDTDEERNANFFPSFLSNSSHFWPFFYTYMVYCEAYMVYVHPGES